MENEVGRKRLLTIIFVALLFLMPFASAVEIIEVQQPQQPQSSSPFSSVGDFFKSGLFWSLIGILILVLIVGTLVFFIVKWAIKFLKLQNDTFYQIRKEKLKLASAQRRMPVNRSWWKFWSVSGCIPIRLVSKDANGKPRISEPICRYAGDYQSHEGHLFIAFYMEGNDYLWIIPRKELIAIPNKKEITIQTKNYKGDITETIIKNIPTADEIVQFNEKEILLYAEGLSNTGSYFYTPVLKSTDGKIIDLSVPVYAGIQEIAIGGLLYNQTDEFVKVARKSIDMSPDLNYRIKASDTNQSVDIPSKPT